MALGVNFAFNWKGIKAPSSLAERTRTNENLQGFGDSLFAIKQYRAQKAQQKRDNEIRDEELRRKHDAEDAQNARNADAARMIREKAEQRAAIVARIEGLKNRLAQLKGV